jgi:hypothetical protein
MAACLVFLAAPDDDPADPQSLVLLSLALAARRGVLLCVPAGGGPGGGGGKAGDGVGPHEAAGRWRGAVEALCWQEGLNAGLCSVVVVDMGEGALRGGDGGGGAAAAGARGVPDGGGGGREGVHGIGDVEDWVRREAAAFHRIV